MTWLLEEIPPADLELKIRSIQAKILARGGRLGIAESCTGGLLAACLTAIPGSSSYFSGGIVAYANDVKTGLLGVDKDLLATHGAVSMEVAGAMVWGLTRTLGVDHGIAITGIAGPGGGTVEKPCGTVWIGVMAAGLVTVRSFVFPGNRHEVRRAAVAKSIEILDDCM